MKKEKNALKTLAVSFSVFITVFIIIPLIVYGGFKVFSYYTQQTYYDSVNKECTEIASDYVMQNYGDNYEIINSKPIYGGGGIFGEPLVGMTYTFKDSDDIFYITVQSGDKGYTVTSDTRD